MTPKPLDLADPVASLRAAAGISQEALAGRLGLTRAAVYQAERGGPSVQLDTLVRYAVAAGGRIEISFVASGE